jgi:hypothetical protein
MTYNITKILIAISPIQLDGSRLFHEYRSMVKFKYYTHPFTTKSDGYDLIMS